MGVHVDARITRRVRTWVLLTLAVAAAISIGSGAFGAPASRAATPPAGFFGLGGWSYPTADQSSVLGGAGVRSFRAGLVWNDVEPTQGQRYWGDVDQLMTNAAQGGYDVLLVLNGCARWACGATRVAPTAGPQLAAYDAFVAAAVQRYGNAGSFWADHPSLTPRTVSWQVWNEVNVGADWPNPNAAAYASFLKAVGSTIKAADSQATVVASGLTEHPADGTGIEGAQFLDQLYAQPGFSSSFDVAAVHAYAEDTAGSVRVLDAMRKVMIAHGDAGRPTWVTEMGWADAGTAHPFVRDAAGQAAELRRSFDTLLACRSRWKLDRVMWFSLQDVRPAALGEPDYWGMHTGLLNADGAPKPAFAAFKEYTNGQPLDASHSVTCDLPGGDAAPDATVPETTITATPKVIGAASKASVTFTASEAGHFDCALDGGPWAACTSPLPVAATREGSHELYVRATDQQGNTDATPAYATWMVDLTAPDTVLTKRPAGALQGGTVSLGFAGRDAVGTKGFQCRSDAGAWKACSSPYRSPKLVTGRHSLSVRAIDLAGNVQVRPTVVSFKTAATTCGRTMKTKTKAVAKTTAVKGSAARAKAKLKATAKSRTKICTAVVTAGRPIKVAARRATLKKAAAARRS